jgi:penicillin-binding protein 1A
LPDIRRGLDLAKLRAKAVQDHIAVALKQRTKLTLATAAGFGGLAALLAIFAVWAWIYWGLPTVPDADALWSLNRQASIKFLDKNGEVIGVRGPYYGRRVQLSELPAYVPQAFLAIEDRRFYEHEGVDRLAIIRAAFANLKAGETVQGASTISQQLARNLFLSPAQTINRKLREMVLASRIERRLSKNDILELYLNRVYLGDQAYGVDAAARRFFNKSANDLSLAEAAILAGLPKAPSRSAPTENLQAALARQHVVLDAMVDANFITARQRDAARAEHIRVAQRRSLESSLGYAFDMAADRARGVITSNAPDLVIQTTIDPALQRAASEAVRVRLGNRAFGRRPLQAAFVTFDRTGAVRAIVGGTDYGASKFNRVTQAKRQPGSSFKTFVYAAALENGLDSEDVRFDEPVVIQGWRPRNYDEGYRGAVTLRTAFALSINTVAASLADEIGQQRVADMARRLGVTTMPDRGAYVPPSIALGSIETTVWDMTSAFGTIMNEGTRLDPHIVEAVYNSAGDELWRYHPHDLQPVIDQDLAHRMISMLGAVVLRGTGTHAQLPGRDVAGKTGTSQDWRDAWFIGFTADYVGGVWTGHDDYTTMGRITGGSIPADIWADVMRVAHADIPPHPLPGIEQPARSPRQVELASFFSALADAFGEADLGKRDSTASPGNNDQFFH